MVAVNAVTKPMVVVLELVACKPVMGESLTVMTIGSALLAKPRASVTTNVNVSMVGEAGVVNVVATLVGVLNVTAVPPVCLHRYVNGKCPSGSLLPLPFSVTVAVTLTV